MFRPKPENQLRRPPPQELSQQEVEQPPPQHDPVETTGAAATGAAGAGSAPAIQADVSNRYAAFTSRILLGSRWREAASADRLYRSERVGPCYPGQWDFSRLPAASFRRRQARIFPSLRPFFNRTVTRPNGEGGEKTKYGRLAQDGRPAQQIGNSPMIHDATVGKSAVARGPAAGDVTIRPTVIGRRY